MPVISATVGLTSSAPTVPDFEREAYVSAAGTPDASAIVTGGRDVNLRAMMSHDVEKSIRFLILNTSTHSFATD
jgi:hypothetical protein